MQVVVDSLITTYHRAGEGEPVVLVHGWGDSSATFRALEEELAKSYEVINVDLPGFGQTQAPPKVWALEDYAKFLSRFLQKIEVEKPVACIGHSNGAAVLIYGLGTGILQADKLVGIAAAGIRTNNKAKRAAFKIAAKTGKAATFYLPKETKQKLRKKLYGAAGSDMLVIPELQETFKMTVRQDVQDEASKIKIPTLLIYGSKDSATPVADGKRYHGLIKDSSLKIVENASHYVHQEQHQTVLNYIKEFLG